MPSKTSQYKDKPPKKLSTLIRLAVKHARLLDRNVYNPHFGTWHSAEGRVCHVCDAGALIAGLLQPNEPKKDLSPGYFSAGVGRSPERA